MNIYRITTEQKSDEGTYPWVGWLGPLADLSYADRLPPRLSENQKAFFKANSHISSGLHIDSGSIWSDILGFGGTVPSFFVSERIINTLKSENIPLLNTIQAPIAKIEKRGKKLLLSSAPNYYLMEAPPGILRNWEEMGYVLNSDGTPNREKMPNPRKQQCLKATSWLNLDIFCPDDPICTTDIYCTDRIVELAEKHQWTNIAFELIRVV